MDTTQGNSMSSPEDYARRMREFEEQEERELFKQAEEQELKGWMKMVLATGTITGISTPSYTFWGSTVAASTAMPTGTITAISGPDLETLKTAMWTTEAETTDSPSLYAPSHLHVPISDGSGAGPTYDYTGTGGAMPTSVPTITMEMQEAYEKMRDSVRLQKGKEAMLQAMEQTTYYQEKAAPKAKPETPRDRIEKKLRAIVGKD